MPSKVEIFNMALGACGMRNRIVADVDEGSEEAAVCSLFYATALQDTLSRAAPNWAICKATLAESTETDSEYEYIYATPADMIRALRIVNLYSDDIVDFVVRKDNQIWTDEEDAELEYVALVEDTTKFSSEFTEAFVLKLAASIAFTLTGNAALQNGLETQYERKLKSARVSDATQNRETSPIGQTFVNARL